MSGQQESHSDSRAVLLDDALAEFRGWNWRHLAFYIGVPAVISVYGAMNNWELQAQIGYQGALYFYAAQAFVPWWITCTMTSIIMLALKPWKPAPIIIMLLGTLVGGILTLPYSNWIVQSFDLAWPERGIAAQFSGLFSSGFWAYMLRAAIVWVAINWFFDRFVGLPRYRYAIPRGYDFHDAPKVSGAEDVSAANAGSRLDAPAVFDGPRPAFLDRVPVQLDTNNILAIKAEQHYIRVYTPEREFMVLYRLSDAVREIDPQIGLQVHRSFWVNKSAIDHLQHSPKKLILLLTTGLEVPVSGPYQGLVRQYAREAGILIRPLPVGRAEAR